MAEADVKLTTVSTGGAKLGSVIPAEALSKSEGKARGSKERDLMRMMIDSSELVSGGFTHLHV